MQKLIKRFDKKSIVIAAILISIGVIAGVIMSSNLGWIPLGQARVEPIPPRITQHLAETEKAFVEISKRVTPAVVNISTTKTLRGMEKGQLSPFFNDPFFRRFFGEEFFREHEMPRKRKEQSLGSGVIVSEDGYIVTNNHVVEGADEIKVVLSDRREFVGKVVGADPKTDLAIVKIKAGDLPAIVWGDSDQIEVGEFVLAIGSPFGLNQTVTSGIISAKGGANVGIVGGVTVQNLTSEFRDRLEIPDKIKGIVVTGVEAGSPAEEYGLKAGDVVMQINKKDTKTIKDFNKIVDDIKKGDSILVLV